MSKKQGKRIAAILLGYRDIAVDKWMIDCIIKDLARYVASQGVDRDDFTRRCGIP